MESLPDDLLIAEMLGRMSLPDILAQCATNRRFAQICRLDRFWSDLTLKDFPHEHARNPGLPWRDYYFQVLRSPILPVYFYQDPIEWVRLTPYNMDRVVELIRGLGFTDQTIVFTHNYFPVCYFVDGVRHTISGRHGPINRVVLLPPKTLVDQSEIITRLATPDPQKGDDTLYGLVEEDELFLGFHPPIGWYDDELLCIDLPLETLDWLAENLALEPNYQKICRDVEERLRSMGRLISESVPPMKPLLE